MLDNNGSNYYRDSKANRNIEQTDNSKENRISNHLEIKKATPPTSADKIKEKIETHIKWLEENYQHYHDLRGPSSEGLRKEYLQIAKYASYYRTCIDNNIHKEAFLHFYEDCAKDLKTKAIDLLDKLRKNIEQEKNNLTSQEQKLLEQDKELTQQQREIEKFQKAVIKWKERQDKWQASLDKRAEEGIRAEKEINDKILEATKNNQKYEQKGEITEHNKEIENLNKMLDIIATDKVKHGIEGKLFNKAWDDLDARFNQLHKETEILNDKIKNHYKNELPANPKVAHLRKLLSHYKKASCYLNEAAEDPKSETYNYQHKIAPNTISEERNLQIQDTSTESFPEDSQGKDLKSFILQDFIEKLTKEQHTSEIDLTGNESLKDTMRRHIAYSLFNQPDKLLKEHQIGTLLTDTGEEISISNGEGIFITLAQEAQFLETTRKYLEGNDKLRQLGPAHSKSNCHGETFANGAGHIDNEDIPTILKNNNYKIILKSDKQVPFDLPISTSSQPQKGDVIIYLDLDQANQNEVTITHSGRLSKIENNKIDFISKWGVYGTYECDIKDYDEEQNWIIVRQQSKNSRTHEIIKIKNVSKER